jgi:putative hemolysin
VTVIAAVAIAFIATLGAAVCAYADGALLSIDPDEPPGDAALASLVGRDDRAHRALAFARVTLQLVGGAAFGTAVHDVRGVAAIPFGLTVLAGLVLVVLSETAARDAGDRAGLAGLARTRGFIEVTGRTLAWVVLLGEWLHAIVTRFMPERDAHVHETEIEQFQQVVASEADMSERGTSMLTGVFALGKTTVADVMTPRIDIVGIEDSAPWSEVVARVRSSEHSRVVVYHNSLDGAVGVLYAKDLLPHVVQDAEPAAGWTSLVRPVPFIPASKRVDVQLREFRATQTHIAIVADEFGGTAGLVTIEDILELIVGEIQDEYDFEEPEIEQRDGRRYWVSGRLSLDQLTEIIGDDLRHADVTTVGGLVYQLLGRIPRAGETVEYKSWKLVIERVRGRRVDRVFLERLVPAGMEHMI